jgi:hypothetical protein
LTAWNDSAGLDFKSDAMLIGLMWIGLSAVANAAYAKMLTNFLVQMISILSNAAHNRVGKRISA